MNAMMVFSLLGGLGLFLFGIKAMGDGLEQAAGSRMKKLLEVLTKNKLLAVLVGALVTGIIQSSSATTVMVVGFVNAGLLNLSRAVGVIMGANIGTTVTSLMLSVELDFAVVFTAVGAICQLLGNRPAIKNFGQITMGLGILFVGMDTMTDAMRPLREWEAFRNMMATATNPIVGVLVGAAVTALLQSSSASVGILQALAGSGAITLEASVFILFGQNIGTCVTALLASVGTSHTGRRAAVVHLLFNVLGTVMFVIIALVLPYTDWIRTLAGDNLRLQIAFSHIVFNVVTTVVLLPLSSLLEKLAVLLVHGEDPAESEPMRLMYFDKLLFSTPPVAVQQLFREVQRMADLVTTNYTFAMKNYFEPKDQPVDDFNNREEVIDFLNDEITQNLIEVEGLSLSQSDVHLVGSLFHVVNDLERIADHATNIVEIGQKRRDEKIVFSAKAEHEIEELSGKVTAMLEKSIRIVRKQITDGEIIAEVIALESQVDDMSEALANHHVDRVKNKKCTPKNGMLYLDMLNNLERIADHADNLASSVDPNEKPHGRLLW